MTVTEQDLKLDTLYKRTRTGAVQQWTVSTEGPQVVKYSGQFGGKLTPHKELCLGKNLGRANETTPSQQAQSQARSDWKKKHDDGYKSLSELGITFTQSEGNDSWYHVEGFETLQRLYVALESQLPVFNTDASGNAKPQLAPNKCFAPGPKNKYPALLEVKFDGNRTFCMLDSINAEPYFLSRSGKPITTVPHLVEAVRVLQEKFTADRFPMILDGELYVHGWELEEINEAVKEFKPDRSPLLEFYMYDLPLHGGVQEKRSLAVAEINYFIDHDQVRHVVPVGVDSDEEVIMHHDKWVLQGYEGAMKKNPKGEYHFGQRNPDWTKVKMFDDTEFEITGYKLGQRGVQDLMFVCTSPKAVEGYDPTFDVVMNGSIESKQKLFDKYIKTDNYIGHQLTVKHFSYTKYGIPNLPKGKAFRYE